MVSCFALRASSVGGSLCNIEFLDGMRIDLYSGCDSESDFDFITFPAALLASQAMLDQVFIDGGSGISEMLPEPGTALLIVLGLVGLGARRLTLG